jgi:tetratricopeptide (TPR) repeat protein
MKMGADEVIKIIKCTSDGKYKLACGEKTMYCAFGPDAPESIEEDLPIGAEIPFSLFKKYDEDGYFWFFQEDPYIYEEAEAWDFYFNGDYDKAVEIYTHLIEQEPCAYEYYFRGRAYFMSGDIASAIQDFDQALKIEPDKTEVKEWLEKAKNHG